MSPSKYVLCRPMGGLNDVLSQIENCCRYAERTGREVIVDTAYPGVDFGVAFSELFISRQARLHLDISHLPAEGLLNGVYPHALERQLHQYQVMRTPPAPYVEANSQVPIQFDFKRKYDEQVLVQHQLGRHTESHFMLLRLGLQPSVLELFLDRLRQIGGAYIGIHVRHTDYQSNYAELLEKLQQNSPKRIFLATDSQLVLDTFRSELNQSEIFSFATDLSLDHRPIHTVDSNAVSALGRNRDAIVDLLLLSMAQSLQVAPLMGRTGWTTFPKYSGFSTLAMKLFQMRIILDHFLKPLSVRGGLGWRTGRVR